MRPSQSPTIRLNPDEFAAWQFLASTLQSSQWTACNANVDPCAACDPPTANAAINCSDYARFRALRRTRLLANDVNATTGERRVTGIVLRNVSASGVVVPDVINTFSQLQYIDLSGNDLSLPVGLSCLPIYNCLLQGVVCNFGANVPVCDASGQPVGSVNPATFTFNWWTLVILGIVFGSALVLCCAAFACAKCRSWRESSEHVERLADARREKRRQRKEQRRVQSDGSSSGRFARLSANLRLSPAMITRRIQSVNIALSPMFAHLHMPPPPGPPPPGLANTSGMPPPGIGAKKRSHYQPAAASFDGEPAQHDPTLAWREASDPATGNKYWTNIVTGQFSWTPPVMAASVDAVPLGGAYGGFGRDARSTPRGLLQPISVGDKGSDSWEEVFDASSGTSTWVNETTGAFSRVRPF